MTWAKLDDRYDDHPKIKRAWRQSGYAVGLHVAAITASCRHESDGLVDPEWLADKLAHLPRVAGRTAIDALVKLRLFDELPAGEALTLDDGRGFEVQVGPLDEDAHVVHDFLDYNESSAFLADRRRRDAERKLRGRRVDSRRNPDGIPADSQRSPDAGRPDSGHPVPSRPVPANQEPPQPPASGGRRRPRASSLARYRNDLTAYAAAHPPEPLLDEWEQLRDRAAAQLDPGSAAYLEQLHPHFLDGEVVLGVGPNALVHVSLIEGGKAGAALRLAAGLPVRVLPCGCDLGEMRGAA